MKDEGEKPPFMKRSLTLWFLLIPALRGASAHPAPDSVFLPPELFPNPLAWTWSRTQGADLTWVPIPFERSFQMAYSRTHYGTGYCIYHQYVRGARLSGPLRSWDAKTPPDRDVL